MRDGLEPRDRDEDVGTPSATPADPDPAAASSMPESASVPARSSEAPVPERPRDVFVVAAPRADAVPAAGHAPAAAQPDGDPATDGADEEPLFIVPAVQPPAPTIEPEPAPPTGPEPVHRPAPEPEHEPAPVIILGPEPDAEPERRRRRMWRPGCFTFLLLLVVALVAGGVYAYQTRAITPRLVLEAIGFGAAEVAFVNLRDDVLRVDLATGEGDDVVPASLRLGALEIRAHRVPRPTPLRIGLAAEDGTNLGSCLLELRYGERYQVVALPSQTLIRRVETVPASGRDLLLGQSSLCR